MRDTTERVEGRVGRWSDCVRGHMGTELERRNGVRFTMWTLVWGASFLGATWLLRSEMDLAPAVTWVVAIVPTLLAAAAILAYLRFLRQADELTQRIQLEALAVGFGIGVLFTIGYQLLERAGAPELATADPVAVMMLGFAAGQIRATLRYR